MAGMNGPMEREQVTVRLPLELKEALQEEAHRKGMTVNDLAMLILNEWNEHRNGKG